MKSLKNYLSTFPQSIETREDFLRKLKWLMFSRVIITTFLLGSTVLIHFGEISTYLEPYLIYLYIIIVGTYLLTLVYALVINRIKNLVLFAYLQIFLDLVFVSAIVHVTGGIESIFSFLYMLSIINSSILLYRRGGFIIASASSILYGACLDLEYYRIIPSITGYIPSVIYYKASDIFYTIAMNITGFYATAFLSSFLAEQVRRSREQLKEKEIDFKQLEALHDNIVQSISSGILTLNKKGEITSFNQAAQEISGHNLSEALGVKFDQIFPLPKNETPNENHETDLNNLPRRFEMTFSRSDGSQLFLGFSISILRDKMGTEMGKIYTFQDLTHYREMEEQIKRMDRLAAAGQLAAGIAHEIRNPLTSLSGSIQVLQDELDLDNENRQLMGIALRETNRLNDLITDFLLFAQPERGEKKKINLTSLIEETLVLFIHSPECQENIKVARSIDPHLYLNANPEQIKQVLWNILKNGVQSQPRGGFINVETQIENREDKLDRNNPHLRIKISIRDGGCGIPRETRKKIFDPFFTTKELGSGLGLSISSRIIESHKGKINIRSQENQGTEVNICFPLISVAS